MKPVPETFLYRFLIKVVLLTSKLMFSSVHKYFRTQEPIIHVPHPTILFANHVSEQDIVALAHAYQNIPNGIKYCYAMRQDIVEPDFLKKEFAQKGFIGFILSLIDKSRMIKILLLYMGGIGIKRAFRDDARKLLKQGELRDLVNSQWDKLAEGVSNGRNIFLFPEGKFSPDGNLDSIKRGTYLISKRIQKVAYNYFNFTYDFLSGSKPLLHIGYGEYAYFPENADEFQVANEIKLKLGNSYVVTAGNIFSYLLFQYEVKSGIPQNELLKKLERLLEKLNSTKKYYIAKELLSQTLSISFDKFLSKAAKTGFITTDSNAIIKTTQKIQLTNFRNGKDMLRKNPYLYHYNQLKYYLEEFDKFYTEL